MTSPAVEALDEKALEAAYEAIERLPLVDRTSDELDMLRRHEGARAAIRAYLAARTQEPVALRDALRKIETVAGKAVHHRGSEFSVAWFGELIEGIARDALASPPPANGGLFATLTPEQEARVTAYRGPENMGEPSNGGGEAQDWHRWHGLIPLATPAPRDEAGIIEKCAKVADAFEESARINYDGGMEARAIATAIRSLASPAQDKKPEPEVMSDVTHRPYHSDIDGDGEL